jgi:hypothetical protein
MDSNLKTVIIIGAGQLGSRHLQSLANCNFALQIFVIDPNETSLAVAKERFQQVGSKSSHAISFFASINEVVKNSVCDVAIIATNANIRAKVTEELIKNVKVKAIVFEKVLFQKQEEYDKIDSILNSNTIKAWVNCPRRMYDVYKDLKKLIMPGEKISFQLQGGEWGLGCNSIHFIDLFSFLNEESGLELNTNYLDAEIIESKRPGYKEYTGTLIGKQENGSEIVLTGRKNSTAPHTIYLQGEKFKSIINESKGSMQLAVAENGWEFKNVAFKVPFQSELTSKIVDDIISKSECDLTRFSESVIIHKQLINELQKFTELKSGQKLDHCPIT